jgi:hypothetical protein
MTFLRSSGQYAIPFVLGLILGAIGMFGYTLASKKPPKVRFQGLVRLDTASHNNAYLSNAIYLQNPTLGLDKIYLNFRDDAVMNAAINRRFLRVIRILCKGAKIHQTQETASWSDEKKNPIASMKCSTNCC